jgi:hypothetical protein
MNFITESCTKLLKDEVRKNQYIYIKDSSTFLYVDNIIENLFKKYD